MRYYRFKFMNIKASLQTIISDRGFFAVWMLMLVLVLVIVILGAVYIRPSDLQIPVRYSSFGITNFYRDKWYYLISIIAFSLIIAVMHTGISLRLLEAKGRPFAIAFLWLTVGMRFVAAVTIFALLRVVTLSR